MPSQPITLNAARLKKDCFSTAQEMLDAFAEALSLSEQALADAIKVIQSKGDRGDKGEDGINGQDGAPGAPLSLISESYPIPQGSAYIDVEDVDATGFSVICENFLNAATGLTAFANTFRCWVSAVVPINGITEDTETDITGYRVYFASLNGTTITSTAPNNAGAIFSLITTKVAIE